VAEEEDVILRLRLRDRLQFAAQLREASRQIEQVGASTRKVSEETSRTTAETERGAKSWTGWGNSANIAVGGGLGFALYGIASGLGSIAEQVVSSGISFNVMKENAQVTFGVLLNSSSKAKVLLGQLFDLAQKSSFFKYQDVLTASQSLLTFGFSARSIIPDLKTLANVASLHPERGSAGIEQLAIILGQIHQSGRLLGQDARQLQQFGIDPYQAIAKRLHETPALVMQQAQQGLISSKVAISAIMDYADQRFGGLAEKLSKTTSGKFANLSDLVTAAEGAFTKPLMGALGSDMQRLIDWLQKPSTQRQIAVIGVELAHTAAAIQPLVIGGTKLAATFAGIIALPTARLLQTLAPEFKALGDLMGIASEHGTVLSLVFVGLTGPMWLLQKQAQGFNWVLGQIQDAWDWLSKHATVNLVLDYSGPGSGALGFIGGAVGFAGGAGSLARSFTSAIPGVGPLVRAATQAEGGMTIDSGWSWVGEQGPELRWMDKGATVLPLDRIGAGGGDPDAIGRAVARHLAGTPFVLTDASGRRFAEITLQGLEDMRSRH
jgi:hypothetical protein